MWLAATGVMENRHKTTGPFSRSVSECVRQKLKGPLGTAGHSRERRQITEEADRPALSDSLCLTRMRRYPAHQPVKYWS